MNINKLIATVAAGALLFGFAGSSMAENNPPAFTNQAYIYGASAQFAYWKAQAGPFLLTQDSAASNWEIGCDSSGKYCIVTDDNQTNAMTVGVANKASFDGICALQLEFETTANNPTTANPNCVWPNGNGGINDGYNTQCPAGERPMVDASTCAWDFNSTQAAMDNATKSVSCTKTICTAVTAGASDVLAKSLAQQSAGMDLGPLGCGSTAAPAWSPYAGQYPCEISRDFVANPVNSNGLTDSNPVVVPFAFYVNNSVTSGGVPITGLTSVQISALFSGKVPDWSDLGFDTKPVTVCLRHAGSGTHASLAFTQMKPGYTLLNAENAAAYGINPPAGYPTVSTTQPAQFVGSTATLAYGVFFNDGTGDEMNCLTGSGTEWTANNGAVGYADADILYQNPTKYLNLVQVTVNGLSGGGNTAAGGQALQTLIVNNAWDYWTIENFYTVGAPNAFHAALLAYAANPSNRWDDFYAENCEMKWWKKTADNIPATLRGVKACTAPGDYAR